MPASLDSSALALWGLFCLVLALPFAAKPVEEALEFFFLIAGIVAVSLQGQWTMSLLKRSLQEPLAITGAVFLAGWAFRAGRSWLRLAVLRAREKVGLPALAFGLVSGLGLLSSLITSVVAALVLAELVAVLQLPRRNELRLAVLGCYAIGLGAALSPVGEPLAAVAMSRLQGASYSVDFFFLGRLLGAWVLPLILSLGAGAYVLLRNAGSVASLPLQGDPERLSAIVWRAVKVYGFVVGLLLLGHALGPLLERVVTEISTLRLYWINLLSAFLDNATLAALELGPRLSLIRVRDLLLGLLIAGGIFIPGNLPNIVCAGKLRLGSREWALFAAPLGLGLMGLVFLALLF